MSSSAASSFSYVPEMLQNSVVFSSHLKARLKTALRLAVDDTSTEHHTARCAILLVSLIFSSLHWNMVPQYYTRAGKWPDFAFERFYYRPGNWREVLFVANVFMEFKPEHSRDDPIEQLRQSIEHEYGQYYRSKGLLIGVKGVKWRFVEYHFVKVPNQLEAVLLLRDFYDFTEGPAQPLDRPTASRIYAKGDYMSFESETEGKDIIRALLWISKGKRSRDLFFQKHHASVLPQSFSHSTLINGTIVEPDAENPYRLGDEFAYLIPLIESELRGDGNGMEASQDQAGGQSQESERMIE